MVVTPDTGSKPAWRNAGMMMISNSSRLEARERTTSSPHVGSNISDFENLIFKNLDAYGFNVEIVNKIS